MARKVERNMDENQKIDANTKRIVASNLTAAYFASESPARRTPSTTPADKKHAMDEVVAIYEDFLIRLGAV